MKFSYSVSLTACVGVIINPSCCCSAFTNPRILARSVPPTNIIFNKLNNEGRPSSSSPSNLILFDVPSEQTKQDILQVNLTEEQESLNQFFKEATTPIPDEPLLNGGSNNLSSSSSSFPSWFEPLVWRGVIMILCALWASNFAAAKLVMAEPGVDSTLYAVARFSIAAIALLLPGILRPQPAAETATQNNSDENIFGGLDWANLKASIICGSFVAFGYLGQTFGLLTTTASRSCVICSLHCVFVAALAELWRVQEVQKKNQDTPSAASSYDIKQLIPAAVAVAGVAIIELQGAAGDPTIGDLLSFSQPIGFGMGYLILEDVMAKKPEAALTVSAIKLSMVALASLASFELMPLLNDPSHFALRLPDFTPILDSPVALSGILYTGLITTALALWVESIAFARVPATDASIILTTEPLIAALFGAVALGETFGMSDYLGAALIVGACVLATLMETPGEEEEEGRTETVV